MKIWFKIKWFNYPVACIVFYYINYYYYISYYNTVFGVKASTMIYAQALSRLIWPRSHLNVPKLVNGLTYYYYFNFCSVVFGLGRKVHRTEKV